MNEESSYSEEAQEVISFVPSWMIRWGNSLILAIIVVIILLSWIIKYPDIITGSFVLSTDGNFVKLNTLSSGKIVKIAEEGTYLKTGDVIAEIENTVTQRGVEQLKESIELASKIADDIIISHLRYDSSLVFGEMQYSFSELIKLCGDYEKLLSDNNHLKQKEFLIKKIHHHTKLGSILKKKIQISKDEIKNYEDKYNIDKNLYKERVLSKVDFYKEETFYRNKLLDFENYKLAEIQNQMTLTDLEKQYYELEFNYSESKRKFKEGIRIRINELKNGVKDWSQRYTITAPTDGKLVALKQVRINHFVTNGDFLFALLPQEKKYVGVLTTLPMGVGKVKIGQRVNVKFDKYPHYEYGVLKGEVIKVSEIPNKGIYEIEVSVPKDMITTYNKKIKFSPDMSGTGDIVTEDLRLIERVLNSFRKLTTREHKKL